MSEGIEGRLRSLAAKRPDEMTAVFAEDVIEVIDGLRNELAAEKGLREAAERERDEARAQHDAFRSAVDDWSRRVEGNLNAFLAPAPEQQGGGDVQVGN